MTPFVLTVVCFLAIVFLFIIEAAIVVFSPLLKERLIPFNPDLRNDEEKKPEPSKTKENVFFYVGNERIDGFFYLPDSKMDPLPCIIMNTGFGGTKEMFVERYAKMFNVAGFAVLTYDYRHFGKSDGNPRQLYSMDKQLEDCSAAISYVRSRKEINADKIIIWGTSGGAGYGLIIAASDDKIACVSCQCGALDHKADSKMAISRDGFMSYLPLIFHAQRDKGRQRFGLGPHYIAIVGNHGVPAIIKAPGAYEGYSGIASEDAENKLCARIMLTPHKNPVEYAHLVKCPVLIQVCENDNVADPQGSINTAKKLGDRATLKKYPIGHFDIYFGVNFKQSIEDQINFYRKHV